MIQSIPPWALSLGKPLPVTVELSSDHGEDVTGLTVTAYLAERRGGTKITTPTTEFALTEDESTSPLLRRYSGSLPSGAATTLIETGAPSFWVAVVAQGMVFDWAEVPVNRHAVISG